MMKLLIPFVILLSLLIFSCGSSNSTASSYQNPHAQAHQQMHNELIIEETQNEISKRIESLTGTYKGSIPCADCEELAVELSLFEDMTYTSKKLYKGKSETTINSSGSFALDGNGIITLKGNTDDIRYFQKHGYDLKVLDKEQNEIIGSLAHMYILRPINKNNQQF